MDETAFVAPPLHLRSDATNGALLAEATNETRGCYEQSKGPQRAPPSFVLRTDPDRSINPPVGQEVGKSADHPNGWCEPGQVVLLRLVRGGHQLQQHRQESLSSRCIPEGADHEVVLHVQEDV